MNKESTTILSKTRTPKLQSEFDPQINHIHTKSSYLHSERTAKSCGNSRNKLDSSKDSPTFAVLNADASINVLENSSNNKGRLVDGFDALKKKKISSNFHPITNRIIVVSSTSATMSKREDKIKHILIKVKQSNIEMKNKLIQMIQNSKPQKSKENAPLNQLHINKFIKSQIKISLESRPTSNRIETISGAKSDITILSSPQQRVVVSSDFNKLNSNRPTSDVNNSISSYSFDANINLSLETRPLKIEDFLKIKSKRKNIIAADQHIKSNRSADTKPDTAVVQPQIYTDYINDIPKSKKAAISCSQTESANKIINNTTIAITNNIKYSANSYNMQNDTKQSFNSNSKKTFVTLENKLHPQEVMVKKYQSNKDFNSIIINNNISTEKSKRKLQHQFTAVKAKPSKLNSQSTPEIKSNPYNSKYTRNANAFKQKLQQPTLLNILKTYTKQSSFHQVLGLNPNVNGKHIKTKEDKNYCSIDNNREKTGSKLKFALAKMSKFPINISSISKPKLSNCPNSKGTKPCDSKQVDSKKLKLGKSNIKTINRLELEALLGSTKLKTSTTSYSKNKLNKRKNISLVYKS